MIFDKEYFNQIYDFLNKDENLDRTFYLANLTADYDKFVFHVKYYIDSVKSGPIIEFNSGEEPYKQIRVLDPDHTFKLERCAPWAFEVHPSKLPPRVQPGETWGDNTAKSATETKKKKVDTKYVDEALFPDYKDDRF